MQKDPELCPGLFWQIEKEMSGGSVAALFDPND